MQNRVMNIQKQVLVTGEILFDIFPQERVLGGAPFNFAYHLTRFGLPVIFCSRVGDDPPGREILERLAAEGISREGIQVEKGGTTGRVQVELRKEGDHSFTIMEDVAYDHIQLDPILQAGFIENSRLIYVGTLIQRTVEGFSTVQGVLARRPENCRVFYDLNLRQHFYTREVVRKTLEQTDILKCNREEMETLQRLFFRKDPDLGMPERLMEGFGLEMVAVTDGEQPAFLYTRKQKFRSDPIPSDDIVDTVGGGDAFSAVMAYGLFRGWEPGHILREAVQFAGRICRNRGAIPDSRAVYADFGGKT